MDDLNCMPGGTSGKPANPSDDMKQHLKAVSPSKPRTKMISIDVSCKQHGLIFAHTAHQLEKAEAPRTRSKSRSASLMDSTKPVPAMATATKSKTPVPTQVAKIQASAAAPGRGRGREGGVKLTRISRKRSAEVLGALNVNNNQQQQSPNPSSEVKDKDANLKRGGSSKRKRFVADGDDNEIAAENIPVEAVFAPLKFGMNKDISPTKRRRLQSLISPMSPPSPPPRTNEMPTSSRFRIARKY